MDRMPGALVPVKYQMVTFEYNAAGSVCLAKYWSFDRSSKPVFILQIRQEYDGEGRTTLIRQERVESSVN